MQLSSAPEYVTSDSSPLPEFPGSAAVFFSMGLFIAKLNDSSLASPSLFPGANQSSVSELRLYTFQTFLPSRPPWVLLPGFAAWQTKRSSLCSKLRIFSRLSTATRLPCKPAEALQANRSFYRSWKIYLQVSTDVVVMVRSSMKALIGGCQTPDLDRGLLPSFSAALTTTFMTRATEMIKPVKIAFSSRYHSDAEVP